MGSSFAIIGGDLRYIRLAQVLANDNNDVYLYGFEKNDELGKLFNVKLSKDIDYIMQRVNYIIAPIPFSKDKEKLFMPFAEKTLSINDFFHYCKDKNVLAGGVSEEIQKRAEERNVNISDLMKNEELTIYNTIATAEGTIKVLIENTEFNLHRSNVLILGFGRVAKTLAKKLQGLDVNITCAARKKTDLTWIEVHGYKTTNINELKENLYQYDIIINTAPNIILTEERLQHVKKDCLLVDLASFPGGIDTDEVKKRGLKYIWALALPGKVAPLASANYIKKAIYDEIIKY